MNEEDFKQVKAGVWEQPIPQGYLMQCCDCGLVHRIDFRVVKLHKDKKAIAIQNQAYKVQLRAYRDDA